ncbi:Efflux transport system, outer membrane factor (OMF) lipoprotein [Psychrobacter nivimaris]|jgi:multidrug efflux system outer membrane protein|uniref:Efflux transport system, outer membrane factor (OMF) lipoprotein n=2 Tax=Psychrobacter TaxID=497 RepID=A0A6N7C200_9GAMM|nr:MULTISPECIES: efflux transporter outer membrane subunit [Psychrobacter]KAF0570169.1 Efflux transport system, outer membrane factor (OMF) lipoprotein [Psychrobacter nivimaris]PKG35977.1 transporter [Psychrobacter sp. Sarcosine-3u-12]
MSSQPFTTNSAAVVTTTAHVRPMSGEQAALVARFASPTIARVRRNSVRLISLTALAMSMAACNTIPKADSRPVLAEPNIPIEQSYGAFDKETASNAAQPSIAGQRWQNFYSDERLKGLIALGLENNKDFESARLAIEKARAQYQITDINDLPTINGSGGYTRQAQNRTDKNPNSSYNVNLGLANYELDFWGKIASLKDQALQNFLATTAAKDSTQISLISNIAQSYANLSYSLAQLKLAEATVESRERSLFIATKRFEAGIDPRLPSLQASASLENAKLAVLRAQSSILTSRNALQYLIGAPIPNELIPTPAVSNITSQKIFNAGLPSELLRYRPDVLQAEYNLKAAGANIEVARASYFPSISLASSIGVSSGSLDDLFKSGAVGWSFGPSISVPIFDAGRLDAEYDVARIEREQTLANYEGSIQTAFREVSDVLATRATLGEQLEAQYRLQDNFEQTYQIADARFKAGISNYLDVLDAQRSLFSTQQGILDLELQKLVSQIELYQALGGGANLDVPTVIPVPQHTNLVQAVNFPAYSNKTKAANAIDAASSARVASVQEAQAIKQSQPSEITTFNPTAVVDVNNDGKTDAAVGVITEETTFKEAGVEQVPVTQINEP